MKYVSLTVLLVAAAVSPVRAQPSTLHLQATSTTAHAITGDVTLTDSAVTFGNGKSLRLLPVTGLFTDDGDHVAASIYQIAPSSDPILLNGNHLCGKSEKPSFMAVWKTEPIGVDVDPHSIAVFSGPAQPAASHAKGLCGIFSYDAIARK